jgi:triosephosphate isomerase
MRTFVAGKGKMHVLRAQLGEIETMFHSMREQTGKVDLLVCEPATLLARLVAAARGLIEIGGEDCSAEEAGSLTGDIEAEIGRGAGATSVILGHSERRQRHHETDAIFAAKAKAKAAWQHGLATILCIGATKDQRSAGEALKVCGEELAWSLPDMPTGARTSIAYEPGWEIGSGTMPARDEVVEVLAHVRSALEKRFGSRARAIRILYGGSGKPGNALSLLETPHVDGLLIGGASLLAADFNAILISRANGCQLQPLYRFRGCREARWRTSDDARLGARRCGAAKSLLIRNRKHDGTVIPGDSAESLRRTRVLDGRRSEVGADC